MPITPSFHEKPTDTNDVTIRPQKISGLLFVVVPLVTGLLFFLIVTPISLLIRAFGKTPLDRGFDARAKSYWVHRPPPAPAPDSMKSQF